MSGFNPSSVCPILSEFDVEARIQVLETAELLISTQTKLTLFAITRDTEELRLMQHYPNRHAILEDEVHRRRRVRRNCLQVDISLFSIGKDLRA